ncbi:hypothetical protein LEN26_007448 [Aphanomyces euteiches]|nr:hypothetical protein AeMF1_007892 [Aphanomyces euteiches]KAH9132302.1 hypothetical protein LEN26_007448 [Aphanomyces euteiches]
MTAMQCQYAYKECTNTRSVKRDGKLHRLCEYHRSRANAMQKTYAAKRRTEVRNAKRQESKIMSTLNTPTSSTNVATIETVDINIDDMMWLFGCPIEPIPTTYSEIDNDITQDDYAFLSLLL